MEDLKPNEKFVGLATNWCAKIKGGYVAITFMKLLDLAF